MIVAVEKSLLLSFLEIMNAKFYIVFGVCQSLYLDMCYDIVLLVEFSDLRLFLRYLNTNFLSLTTPDKDVSMVGPV